MDPVNSTNFSTRFNINSSSNSKKEGPLLCSFCQFNITQIAKPDKDTTKKKTIDQPPE